MEEGITKKRRETEMIDVILMRTDLELQYHQPLNYMDTLRHKTNEILRSGEVV